MMRERPIIMSAPMVRAILAGRKTQTRRVVKPHRGDDWFVIMDDDSGDLWPYRSDDGESCFVTIRDCLEEVELRCPYGKAGDRLWVRETWRADDAHDSVTMYRTDVDDDYAGRVKWRSPIHLPQDRSRLTLEITAVRVERLQGISEADAMAEGASPVLVPPDGGSQPHVVGYRDLWESIHGPDSWTANPWVWVVEFRAR